MSKSFTLVELLIVIGILAILTAAVVVVLNPAELLKQARDSKRLQDLTSIDKSLQVSQAIYPDISLGTASTVYVSIADTTSTCANIGLPSLPSGWSYACVTSSNLTRSDGTGWMPVNFQDVNLVGAVQLQALPIDPTNTTSTGLYYTYTMGGSWQITSLTESDKYAANAANDGGQDHAMLEKGSDLTLTPFAHGLVGYWKFDESSGTTAYDSSGWGNNGTMYSASTTAANITTSSGCVSGRCLDLDGVDNYVDVPRDSSITMADKFSISVWIRTNDITDRQFMISNKNGGGTKQYEYQIYESKLSIYLWKSGGSIGLSSDNVLSSDTLYNFVTVYDGSTLKHYVNGSPDGELSTSGVLYSAEDPMHIGKMWGTDNGQWFVNGMMDSLKLYKRALSSGEVEAMYNAPQ